jgi:hypothetical protein
LKDNNWSQPSSDNSGILLKLKPNVIQLDSWLRQVEESSFRKYPDLHIKQVPESETNKQFSIALLQDE